MAKNNLRRLAERVYDLDAKVYKELGSSLGRVFRREKKATVHALLDIMKERQSAHILRSDMALIGNMARTIPDAEVKKKIMDEYREIMSEIEALPASFESDDILDEEAALLNPMDISKRFADEDHLIVCISRTYGSGGSTIGFNLAERLNVDYYDTEIFNMVLQRLEGDEDAIEDIAGYNLEFNEDGEHRFVYVDKQEIYEKSKTFVDRFHEFDKYHGLPKRDAVFFNTSQLICEMARKQDFVIMGRCADVILTNNHIPHISIFITAPLEQRIKHVMKVNPGFTPRQAKHLIKKHDQEHLNYYEYFTGRRWGIASNYDLTVNSSAYGIAGSLELIMRVIPDEWEPMHEVDVTSETE